MEIKKKIFELSAYADEIPGIVMVHNMNGLTIEFMSKRGLEILGVTLDELRTMGPEYHQRFFDAADMEEQVPTMMGLLERNDDNEIVALFQHVRRGPDHPWQLYLTSVKIFMRDGAGRPLLILAVAIPVDPLQNLNHKVNRLLEENRFLRENYTKFSTLTKSEKRILKGLAIGKSSVEISKELHISPLTVDTHRKKIKHKLGVNNSYELAEFARAFDII